jgi:hypothetical protein
MSAPETSAVCLKGRREEFGSSLQLPAAEDVVYVGRAMHQGGWRLARSPFANPFRAQRVGGAAKAVELYFMHLRAHHELVARARRELAGKRLGCWCPTDDPQLCHAALLAAVVAMDAEALARLLGGPIGAAL